MDEEISSGLALLHIYRDIILNVDDVIEILAKEKENDTFIYLIL